MDEIEDIHRPRPSNGLPADTKFGPEQQGSIAPSRQSLVIVDRRTVIGRCLGLWICAFEPEFHPVSTTSIGDSRLGDVVSKARAVIFCTGAAEPRDDRWLREQFAWTRKNLPDVPLVPFAESPDAGIADATAKEFQLSGYIPTCTSLELAATALRLIIAGGHYIPQTREGARTPEQSAASPQLLTTMTFEAHSRLTARERSVLDLLGLGLPNKIIGCRLGMSESTVKGHVHNIIAKLKVRNRTGAALARFGTSALQTSFALPPPAVNLDDGRSLDETA